MPAHIPGNEGDTQTLYAVWQQGQPITFNMDSNTSSIDIIDSNGTTAKTITASSQTVILAQWTSCSSLAVGDAEEVYDTRDN